MGIVHSASFQTHLALNLVMNLILVHPTYPHPLCIPQLFVSFCLERQADSVRILCLVQMPVLSKIGFAAMAAVLSIAFCDAARGRGSIPSSLGDRGSGEAVRS